MGTVGGDMEHLAQDNKAVLIRGNLACRQDLTAALRLSRRAVRTR